VVAFSFPYTSDALGGGHSFMIFAIMMVLQLIFVLKLMPETKGKTLEEVEGLEFLEGEVKRDLVTQP
jgi:hypothetical protein